MIYTIYLLGKNSEMSETISLDVIKSFNESYSSSIAQNTVENGYVISDSISLGNPKFDISGVITDSKFRVRDELVIFVNKNSDGHSEFIKQSDSRDQEQQIDEWNTKAKEVRKRLIELWEKKEIFGLLESSDATNVQGSEIRKIFPCILTNLSFDSSDASDAFYPRLSIEKITYSYVKTTNVTRSSPELIPKWQEEDNKGNGDTGSVETAVKDVKNQVAKDVAQNKGAADSVKPITQKEVDAKLNSAGATSRRMWINMSEDNRSKYNQQDWIQKKAKEIYENDMTAEDLKMYPFVFR